MARLIENVVYRAGFHNFSCIHHIYKIGYFRHHTQIVRDINNSDAGALLNILNKLQNFCLHCYIQRRSWLVANQEAVACMQAQWLSPRWRMPPESWCG